MDRQFFAKTFKYTVPVLLGYIPLGITYGLLFSRLGYHWAYAPISSLLIFAGSAQFLSVGLLAAHASLQEIFFSTLILNARHLFYGLAVAHRFDPRRWLKTYQIHTLADETFSVLTTVDFKDRNQDRQFCIMVTVLNQSYWVLGSFIGAILGKYVHFDITGVEFVLTALFMVLTLEQAKKVGQIFPFAVAGLAATVAYLSGSKDTLITGLSITFLILLLTSKYKEKLIAAE